MLRVSGLSAAARKSGTCPFCRKKLAAGTGHVDLRMERKAANTVRTCPYERCAFSGRRDKLREHVRQ